MPHPIRAALRPLRALGQRLSTRRRKLGALGLLLVVVIGVVLLVTDPFASGPSSSGVSDNAYPVSTTTVQQESITSQTSVSATLGYAGSYTVTIPTGTAASEVTADEQTVSSDATKVANDTSALATARATAAPTTQSTLLSAEQTVSSDQGAVDAAKTQLASDQRLGCPASSSATVTTALGGTSSPSGAGSPSSGSGSPSSGSGSPSSGSNSPRGSSSPAGTTGSGKAHVAFAAEEATTTGPPVVTVSSGSGATSSAVSLSGTVDPNGLSTQYAFEYGTTSALGTSTPSTDAGSGTSASSVSLNVTGLMPDTTYDFVLVATNADGTTTSTIGSFQTTSSSCEAERAVLSEDETALAEATDTLQIDRVGGESSITSAEQTLASDQAVLAAARAALSQAEAGAVNPNTTFTSLPKVGAVIDRGQSVYSLDDAPVPLLYGTTTLFRSLYLGVSDGPDVAELQQNLIALGFGNGITASDHFSGATQSDLKAWQASLGLPATGVVALGDVVVEPGAIQVDTVSAAAGSPASASGTVLTATSTSRVVTIDLDASDQSEVKVGDPVTVTLPDNSTTPGVVSSVGTVATAPSSGGGGGNTGGGSTPTITVEVTLTNPKATGNLDQTPVDVAITNGSVANALVVPVDALLALSSGGYALEVVGAGGVHSYEAVTLGLFDDADGLVQVSGAGVQAGQKIVVPNT